jgi:hypothetical protein
MPCAWKGFTPPLLPSPLFASLAQTRCPGWVLNDDDDDRLWFLCLQSLIYINQDWMQC